MKYVKVCVSLSYVVPAYNDDAIAYAKEALYEDLMNSIKYDEVAGLIDVEDVPNAVASDVPDFISEYISNCCED